MYKNLEDAVAVLSGLAEDTLIAAIVSLAMPVVVLDRADRVDPNPLTFIGGAPVWSEAREWPTPPLPDNIGELSDRGGDTHRPHIKESLTAQLPYSFVGQIDLQSVDAAGLPKTGRLHFFYDIATGPWDTGQRSAHVIWDQTPVADLVEASVPAVLLAAEARDKERAMQPVELDEATLEILRQTGMSEAEIAELLAETAQPPDDPGNFLIGPKRALASRQAVQLPVWSNIEWEGFVESVSQRHGTAINSDALADIMDASEIKIEARLNAEDPRPFVRSFQLGGLPFPEQDDPRISAAVFTVLGKQYLEEGDWERHKTELFVAAHKFKLLFQFSVADWLDSPGEGTVYFLISDQDLEARNFETVIAVYQQT